MRLCALVSAALLTACGPTPVATPADGGNGPRYEIRLPVTELGADGFSKIPVLVLGTNVDGSPATDAVLLSTSRPGAGTIEPQSLTLGAMGATAYFTPCSSASAGCVGTVKLQLSLASAPSIIVAQSSELDLVAPQGVGNPAPCMTGGNVLFFDGDSGDYIHPGTATITVGTWSASASPAGAPNYVTFDVTPSDSSQGLWWTLDFSSRALDQPLAKQTYEGAERAAFASPGHPGIDVGGDGRGCNEITGKFQIHELALDSTGALTKFLATFEQHCEGGSAALRGCVAWSK